MPGLSNGVNIQPSLLLNLIFIKRISGDPG